MTSSFWDITSTINWETGALTLPWVQIGGGALLTKLLNPSKISIAHQTYPKLLLIC